MNDIIVEEVREIRATLAAKFDYDLSRIMSDALMRDQERRKQKPTDNPGSGTRMEAVGVPVEPDF